MHLTLLLWLVPVFLVILIILVVPSRTIILIGFQGSGSKHKELFIDTEPLSYAGHVALSFDGGRRFFGFTPHAPGSTNRALIFALQHHIVFPGHVGDDRAVFERAVQLWTAGYTRSPVYEWRQRVSLLHWWRIRRRVLWEAAHSPVTKRYGFPKRDEPWYNCATWPYTIGVDIPEESGQLSQYIDALRIKAGDREWQP